MPASIAGVGSGQVWESVLSFLGMTTFRAHPHILANNRDFHFAGP